MNFARTLATVSGLTVVSRVAGFVRDTLIATLLGAGHVADAFFIAQRLPNLFRSLFAEGAFSAAFVPLYATEERKEGLSSAQQFAAEAQAALLAVLIPFSILIIIFMPYVIQILAPGFNEDETKFELAVNFSRIAFPYLTLISITALQGGVLNANKNYGPAAAAPIALNIVMITAMLLSKPMGWEIGTALSWGVTVSGVVQMAWLAISCYRANISIPLALPRFTARTIKLFKQIGPGAIGAGATQINILVATILASHLPTGAISYLFYADRLNQLPLGIVGIAVATTLLPILSQHAAAGDEDKIKHYMSRSVEFCLALGLPATIGLSLAAQPIIQTLFERGAFTHLDTIQTSRALFAYSGCIPAFLLIKVFSADFFARHDTKTPVRIAVVAMISNVVCSLLLIEPLGHVGIALATTIATWVNASLLFTQMRKYRKSFGDERLAHRMPRLFASAAGMALMTWFCAQETTGLFAQAGLWYKIGGLALVIGPSGLAYLLLLHFTGAMKWNEVRGMMKKNKG